MLFQAGRFRRIAVLPELTSRSGRALARGTDDRPWFAGGDAGGGGGGLLLGSPGLNDAALQVLQASTPDRRVWPAGCAGVRFSGVAASGPVEIRAAARDVRRALPVPAQGRGPLVGQTGAAASGTGGVSGQSWDVEAVDAAGRVLVTWRGVTLREAGLLPRDPAWPAALLPAYLERGAIRLGLDPDLRITASGGSGLVLEAGGAPFAACGWVPADTAHPVWPGPGQAAAFSQLCGQLSEPPVASAARLRAAACLAGPEAAGLAFGRAAADGWALLEAGRLRVATTVVQVEGLPWPIAIAVTTDRAGRERRLPGGSRVAGPPVSVV